MPNLFTLLLHRFHVEVVNRGHEAGPKSSVFKRMQRKGRLVAELTRKAKNYFIRHVIGGKTAADKLYIRHCLSVEPDASELELMRFQSNELPHHTVFSILLPVYNAPEIFLRQCLDSVIHQAYPHWELCVSDDCSTDPQIKNLLESYRSSEPRIKVSYRDTNGHISANSNDALQLATGSFIVLLDQDDTLAPHALFRLHEALQQNDQLDLIYSDEDKIDAKGRRFNPFFKPSWSPESLLSRNYVCHLVAIRRSLVNAIGGFRVGFEGSQDHDLLLRASEQCRHIQHLPEILYHWRIHAKSTAFSHGSKPYALQSGLKAVKEALERRNIPAEVHPIPHHPGCFEVVRLLPESPAITVIVDATNARQIHSPSLKPFKNAAGVRITKVIFVLDPQAPEALQKSIEDGCAEMDIPFSTMRHANYFVAINTAAKETPSAYLCCLRHDLIPLHDHCLQIMVSYAVTSGVVGCKVISQDDYVLSYGSRVTSYGSIVSNFAGHYNEDSGYLNYMACATNVGAIPIDCMLIRKNVFDDVGGFDTTLTGDWMAADLCLRLSKQGWYPVCIPNAILKSSRRFKDILPKSKSKDCSAAFMERWGDFLQTAPMHNPNLDEDSPNFTLAKK